MCLRPARMIVLTINRSKDMSNKSKIFIRIGEGFLALAATAVSLMVLQFAMVG
jgi:hypothetical protein